MRIWLRELLRPALACMLAAALALGGGLVSYGQPLKASPQQSLEIIPESSQGLAITPTTTYYLSGYTGGPFLPLYQNYLLRNTTASALGWRVSNNASWLTLTRPNNWKLGTAAPGWSSGVAVAAFAGKLWLLGSGSEVWSSANGIAWTRVTAAALPGGGSWGNATIAVFKNALWVSPNDQPGNSNQIYKSTDGVTWVLASAPQLITTHASYIIVAYNNRLWILGSASDIWSSPDGIHWELVTAQAPWGNRYHYAAVVYNGRLWVLGGSSKNDVWSTADGVNWVQVKAAAPWSPRSGLAAAVHDGKLWVLGGYDGAYHNDAWYTRDGVSWTMSTAAAPWPARSQQASISFAGKLWVMGGSRESPLHDVYYNQTTELSGTLAPGAGALIEAAVNATASTLAASIYSGQIAFTNTSATITEFRTATLQIETPPPTLTINNISVTEGNSGTKNAVLTVRLSKPSFNIITVNYATADGTATSPSDYQAAVGIVVIRDGATTAPLTIRITGDTRLEPNETFFVNFSKPGSALLGTWRAQVTIVNDEAIPNPLYVDDNAPGDPGPGNPLVSDPLENGTSAHPFDSIQEAIDVAPAGSTVIVAQGTYRENLKFNGRNITVRSSNPPNASVVAATIVDGRATGPVVTFSGTESASCLLYGLTLTNGYAPFGGGILGNGTHATLQYNRIARNRATIQGAGVYRCHGSILNNTVTLNLARALSPDVSVAGGGLYDCDGLIRGNTISNNTSYGHGSSAYAPPFGGGLAACDGTIENNEISGNVSGRSGNGNFLRGHGGGLYDCQAAIRANRIVNNHTSGYGGGLEKCNNVVINNAILNNWAEWGGGGLITCDALIMGNTIDGNRTIEQGGGLSTCNAHIQGNIIRNNYASRADGGGGLYRGSGIIENNLIAANHTFEGGSGIARSDAMIVNNTIVNNDGDIRGRGAVYACTGIIANNIIWGNFNSAGPVQITGGSLPSYSIIQGWTGGGTGNSGANPRFINPSGNFHLQAGSPAIDTGSNALVPRDFDDLNNNGNTTEPEPYDADGNPRIVDGNGNGTVIVDKGAYEYQP